MEESMIYESDDINVSHPDHYQGADGMEVIDVIRNFLTGPEYKGYLRGNIVKYILRYDKKNGSQDLEKAMWYLSVLTEYVKKEEQIKKQIKEQINIFDESPITNEEYVEAINCIRENIKEKDSNNSFVDFGHVIKKLDESIENMGNAIREGYLGKV